MRAENKAQLPMESHLATSQSMGEKKLPMTLISVRMVKRMLESRTYKNEERPGAFPRAIAQWIKHSPTMQVAGV